MAVAGDSLIFLSGELDFAPAANADAPTYDLILSAAASVTVAAGAALVGSQTMLLGQDGTATRLDAQGTVEENYAVVDGGELVVSGTGRWIAGASGIQVGGVGDGRLTIDGGGTVTVGATPLSSSIASLQIGDDFGKGTAQVLGRARD